MYKSTAGLFFAWLLFSISKDVVKVNTQGNGGFVLETAHFIENAEMFIVNVLLLGMNNGIIKNPLIYIIKVCGTACTTMQAF